MGRAHVVALVIDASVAAASGKQLTRREIALAADVVGEGRALLAVVNKLDTFPEDQHRQVTAQNPHIMCHILRS